MRCIICTRNKKSSCLNNGFAELMCNRYIRKNVKKLQKDGEKINLIPIINSSKNVQCFSEA